MGLHYSYTSHTFPNASCKKQLTQSVHKPNKSLSISSRTEAPFDPKTKIQFLLLNSPPRGYAQKALSQLILSTPLNNLPQGKPKLQQPQPKLQQPQPFWGHGTARSDRSTACHRLPSSRAPPVPSAAAQSPALPQEPTPAGTLPGRTAPARAARHKGAEGLSPGFCLTFVLRFLSALHQCHTAQRRKRRLFLIRLPNGRNRAHGLEILEKWLWKINHVP